jgi:hypothetical protein
LPCFPTRAPLTASEPARPETPLSLRQALRTSERESWIEAWRSELSSLRENDTYDELPVGTSPPRGRTAIPGRFVSKIKMLPSGEVDKFKTRVVAKGFKTVKGVDYDESFAPTLRIPSFRVCAATACQRQWALHQLDCTTAFLVPPQDPSLLPFS